MSMWAGAVASSPPPSNAGEPREAAFGRGEEEHDGRGDARRLTDSSCAVVAPVAEHGRPAAVDQAEPRGGQPGPDGVADRREVGADSDPGVVEPEDEMPIARYRNHTASPLTTTTHATRSSHRSAPRGSATLPSRGPAPWSARRRRPVEAQSRRGWEPAPTARARRRLRALGRGEPRRARGIGAGRRCVPAPATTDDDPTEQPDDDRQRREARARCRRATPEVGRRARSCASPSARGWPRGRGRPCAARPAGRRAERPNPIGSRRPPPGIRHLAR